MDFGDLGMGHNANLQFQPHHKNAELPLEGTDVDQLSDSLVNFHGFRRKSLSPYGGHIHGKTDFLCHFLPLPFRHLPRFMYEGPPCTST